MAQTVKMGELVVQSGDTPIRTLLGSCVGIVLHCPNRELTGLAHALLPFRNDRTGPDGKFVDQAIPAMLSQLAQRGAVPDRIQAKLFGGANMLQSTASQTIGSQNLAAAYQVLAQHSVRVVGEHVGGTQGRRLTVTPSTGQVTVDIVGGDSLQI